MALVSEEERDSLVRGANTAQQQAASSAAKKAKKQRPAKAKKAPRAKREKGEKVARERNREGGKKKGKAIAAIIIIGAVAFLGASYYMNWFGVKDKVVNFFISQDGQYQAAMADVESQKASYDQKEAEVAELEETLLNKEKQLTTREQALLEAEQAAQEASSSTTSASQVSGTGTDLEDLYKSQLALVYEKMDSADAAAILNTIADNGWIATLFMEMNEKKVANIMAELNTEKAAIISRLMSE